MTFPILYHKGSKGEIRSWKIWTEGSTIFVEHGTLNGQKVVTKTVCTPKNIGKKNGTTAESQADFEAEAKHKYQLERKYSLTPEVAKETVFLPMLAHSFEKEKKKVKYPVFVQPKLDGVRALASWKDGKVVLISRSGKPYNVPHISKELENILGPNDVFDGELYIHDKTISFETKMSWIKKLQPNTVKLEYHVYDFPVIYGEDSLSYLNRKEQGSDFTFTNNIKLVSTFTAFSETDVLNFEKQFVLEGFEGAIVRFYNGSYKFGHRSHDLLKVKSFLDEEFQVVGYEVETQSKVVDGTNKDLDCVVWKCKSKNNFEIFNVRPTGTLESRQETLYDVKKHANKYLGKLYKVKFQEYTDYGIPRFPVGLGFRLEEDI